MNERVADREGGIKLLRRECMDRERRRLFRHGRLLGGCFRRERGVSNYR